MKHIRIVFLLVLIVSPTLLSAQRDKDTTASVEIKIGSDTGARIHKGTLRLELEHAFKLRTEEALREKVKLTEEQIEQVRKLVAKYGPKKQSLFRQSQLIGMELRRETAKGDSADQKRVLELMKTSTDLQKSFVNLVEEEDEELAAFMTPVQIVQYKSIQSQLRLRLLERRRSHMKVRGTSKDGFKVELQMDDSAGGRAPAPW